MSQRGIPFRFHDHTGILFFLIFLVFLSCSTSFCLFNYTRGPPVQSLLYFTDTIQNGLRICASLISQELRTIRQASLLSRWNWNPSEHPADAPSTTTILCQQLPISVTKNSWINYRTAQYQIIPWSDCSDLFTLLRTYTAYIRIIIKGCNSLTYTNFT